MMKERYRCKGCGKVFQTEGWKHRHERTCTERILSEEKRPQAVDEKEEEPKRYRARAVVPGGGVVWIKE